MVTNKVGKQGAVGQVPKRLFHLNVQLFTGEKFRVEGCYGRMLVRELKEKLELSMGIPAHIIRLFYLDGADLIDDEMLKYVDIIPGALLKATVWNQWLSLVEAAVEGDVFRTLRQGVTKDSKYNDANSANMLSRARFNWLQERAGVALFIASHRGHEQLVTRLLMSGSNVSAQTPGGRTALHACGAQGNVKSLLTLLQYGADTSVSDNSGQTALTLAASMGQRQCERYLFMHEWQQRAKKSRRWVDKRPLMAHQMYDSHVQTWYTGTQSRLYTAEILPPEEFSGTRLSAPKRTPVAPRSFTAPEKAMRHSRSRTISQEGERRNLSRGGAMQSSNHQLNQNDPNAVQTQNGRPSEPYLPRSCNRAFSRQMSAAAKIRTNPSWVSHKSGDNWISRRPESILQQLGVGMQ